MMLRKRRLASPPPQQTRQPRQPRQPPPQKKKRRGPLQPLLEDGPLQPLLEDGPLQPSLEVGPVPPVPDWTSLPEIVWPTVFKFLDHYDLMKIIRVGQKLGFEHWVSAASSKALWKDVTWTVPVPVPEQIQEQKPQKPPNIEQIKKHLGPHTTSLRVIGAEFNNKDWIDFVHKLANLKRLHYINCKFNFLARQLQFPERVSDRKIQDSKFKRDFSSPYYQELLSKVWRDLAYLQSFLDRR